MSYGRDRDAHHRGVGAVAAADHMKMRGRKRSMIARGTARRDAQLSGLTYGRTGGLAGFGALEELGAINLRGTPMQNVRTPVINYGTPPDGSPTGPRVNPYAPTLGQRGPTIGGGVPAPPLRPGMGSRLPINVLAPASSVPTTGGTLCSRADMAAGRCPGQGGKPPPDGSGSGGGSTWGSGGSTGGGSGGGGGGSAGAGAGIDSGGSGPTFTPPPDVPDMPDAAPTDTSDTVTILGTAVSKKALMIGGGIAAAILLMRRRKR